GFAAEAVDRRMQGAETEAAGEEEGAGLRRIEAQARIERTHGEGGALLGAGPAGGADGKEQFGTQRATEGEAAAQAALAPVAVLAAERAVAEPATEPESLAYLIMLGQGRRGAYHQHQRGAHQGRTHRTDHRNLLHGLEWSAHEADRTLPE